MGARWTGIAEADLCVDDGAAYVAKDCTKNAADSGDFGISGAQPTDQTGSAGEKGQNLRDFMELV